MKSKFLSIYLLLLMMIVNSVAPARDVGILDNASSKASVDLKLSVSQMSPVNAPVIMRFGNDAVLVFQRQYV